MAGPLDWLFDAFGSNAPGLLGGNVYGPGGPGYAGTPAPAPLPGVSYNYGGSPFTSAPPGTGTQPTYNVAPPAPTNVPPATAPTYAPPSASYLAQQQAQLGGGYYRNAPAGVSYLPNGLPTSVTGGPGGGGGGGTARMPAPAPTNLPRWVQMAQLWQIDPKRVLESYVDNPDPRGRASSLEGYVSMARADDLWGEQAKNAGLFNGDPAHDTLLWREHYYAVHYGGRDPLEGHPEAIQALQAAAEQESQAGQGGLSDQALQDLKDAGLA